MSSAANAGVADQGPGLRLRQAREAAGLSVSEVAAKMRVPVRVVRSLEAGEWDRLGAAVFLRGKLRSYAIAVGLPPDALQPPGEIPPVSPPVLQPRTYTPRLRRVAEQAARRMVYVVITATLAVPVWMVTRGHIDGTPAETAVLDVAVEPVDAIGELQPQQRQQRPLVASMAPLQTRRPAAATASQDSPAPPALTLRFNGDSWVEVLSGNGDPLEQALVRAGAERTYRAGEVGRVVLGNAEAVEVSRFGRVQDIGQFQRANVARFTVSSDGSLAPATD